MKASINTLIVKQQIEIIYHALHPLRHSTTNQSRHHRWDS